jgi:hypothetical protein
VLMTSNGIKTQLTKFVKQTMGSENPRFSGWYSGITNNEKRRKAEHSYKKGLIDFWKCYEADNVANANEVEAYFHNKGTKNSPHGHGAIKTSVFVYIFKLPTKQPMGLGGPFTEENLLKQIFGD